MNCNGACFHPLAGVSKNPIYHSKSSYTGLSYFFCGSHRAVHCMNLTVSTAQPKCGECSLVFYQNEQEAQWLREKDQQSVMDNSLELLIFAAHDLQTQREEANPHLWARLATTPPTHPPVTNLTTHDPELDWFYMAHVPYPGDIADDARDEIPRDDPTYIDLDPEWSSHHHIENLSLLKYRTFLGNIAYMPCAEDIEQRNIFFRLKEEEVDAEPIFQQGRIWACKIQAQQNLPKDVRWVLMVIYDYCCDILRDRQITEDGIWQARPWLRHWYEVIDALFDGYGIDVSSPVTDWFTRPISRIANRHLATMEEVQSLLARGQERRDAIEAAITRMLAEADELDGSDNEDPGGAELMTQTSASYAPLHTNILIPENSRHLQAPVVVFDASPAHVDVGSPEESPTSSEASSTSSSGDSSDDSDEQGEDGSTRATAAPDLSQQPPELAMPTLQRFQGRVAEAMQNPLATEYSITELLDLIAVQFVNPPNTQDATSDTESQE